MTEIFTSLMYMIKGNYDHIGPILSKIGANPPEDEFEDFLKVVEKFRHMLKDPKELK